MKTINLVIIIIFIHHIMVAATQQKSNKKKKQKDTVKTMNSYSITLDTTTHYWQHSCSISSHILATNSLHNELLTCFILLRNLIFLRKILSAATQLKYIKQSLTNSFDLVRKFFLIPFYTNLSEFMTDLFTG